MIEVNNIKKSFTKKVNKKEKITFYADNDVSFTANEGEIVGILGPNGAGKTTLLRIISGIMTPNEGQIKIDDMKYDKNPIDIKNRISFLTGNTKLYKDVSPYELLEMCGKLYGMDKQSLKKSIDDIIERFDMSSFAHQRIESLSTGQYQRVSIARCVIHNPKYYIFDEITSGLDVISSKVILDFIKEEKERNKCILYSTHYMEEAENICDKIVMINKGEVIIIGTPDEIKKKTKTNNLRESFFKLVGEEYE